MDKESIDFNGNSVPAEPGQSETTEKVEETKEPEKVDEPEKVEESVETLKERLKKVEEEKENYKKGMLKYKDLTLEKEEKKEEPEEEYPDWDENSKKFQKQTLSQAEKVAEERARKIVEKNNEKQAIRQFLDDNPDADWNEIVDNYYPKNGKESVKDILKDLNRAYFWTRHEKGDSDDKKKAQIKVAEMSSVSKTTAKSTKQGATLSEASINMAKKMRVNPEKLALEDDSNTAVINF